MKIFLCGYGSAARSVLRALVCKYGVANVALFSHDDDDLFGQHILNVADNLDIWHSAASVNRLEGWPFQPDVIASVYYRTIIRQPVIDAVGGKVFNAHTSLLPRNRGRSPIPWAIMESGKYGHTGVSFHYIDNEGIDTGPIILQAAIQISPTETQTSLFEKIHQTVCDYFGAALTLVQAGFPGVAQRGEATYHQAGPPYDGEIDPAWPFDKIERFIRAMTYPPLPYARFMGEAITSEGDYREALARRDIARRMAA